MIVVTGASGFIGQHLCYALRERGKDVHEIDLRTRSDINNCDLPEASRVFHLAAQTDAYHQNARFDAITNIIGSIRIFEQYGDKVVFTSSAMVNYPCNPYAISKRACEDYAKYFGAAIVRLPNVYGPGGHSLIDVCETNDEINIYGTGQQVRTYQHVDVVIKALLDAEPGVTKVVQGDVLSVNQIVSRYDKPVNTLPAREGDLLYAVQLD